MRTKNMRIGVWLIPPILFFAFFSLHLLYVAIVALYPDFSSDIPVVLQFGVLTSIVYLLALVLFTKLKNKAAKKVVIIVSSVILVAIVCFAILAFFLGGYVSKTTDIDNYLVLDEGSLVHNNECKDLMPDDVPENSVNHVYDYCYRCDLFSGSYIYAEWTLPENEYIAEKQRIADSADTYNLKCYQFEKQDVYKNSSRDVAQFSFSDADCCISYYLSYGVIHNPIWETIISE